MDSKLGVVVRCAVRAAVSAGMAALLSAAPIAFAAEAPKAPEAPPAKPPAEEESKLKHLAPAEAASVLGRPVRGPDGKDIGRVVDVLVDQAGHPRAAVIDFGGFMGVGS